MTLSAPKRWIVGSLVPSALIRRLMVSMTPVMSSSLGTRPGLTSTVCTGANPERDSVISALTSSSTLV